MEEENVRDSANAAETEQNKESPNIDETHDDYYAYDLYPERKSRREYNWTNYIKGWYADETYYKRKCESYVYESLTTNPLVRILLNALKNAGCPVDISKNISCEVCESTVTGGYDVETNQIVLCQNSGKVKQVAGPTLIHELIHMYDYCVNDVDFKNLEHLACTEIRAANLTHCSFVSSFFLSQSSLFNIKATHKYCVKVKAAQSLMVSRKLDQDTALKLVSKVFDKCYNDLEPIGRRIRRNSPNGRLAYEESKHFCGTAFNRPT